MLEMKVFRSSNGDTTEINKWLTEVDDIIKIIHVQSDLRTYNYEEQPERIYWQGVETTFLYEIVKIDDSNMWEASSWEEDRPYIKGEDGEIDVKEMDPAFAKTLSYRIIYWLFKKHFLPLHRYFFVRAHLYRRWYNKKHKSCGVFAYWLLLSLIVIALYFVGLFAMYLIYV